MTLRGIGLLTLTSALVLCTGCTTTAPAASRDDPSAVLPPPGHGAAPSSVRPAASSEALDDLTGLRVVDRHPAGLPPYERGAFGRSWSDVDRNGCNQRDDVLLRDAMPDTVRVQHQGACDHDVLAGRWLDPYTGKTLTFDNLKDLSQAQAIQIDHVVPLAEAWVSGAAAWTEQRRELFANDLSGLLAVDGPANSSKGAGDPAAWRPRKEFQCAYAVRWITVKATWHLGVDASEERALKELLGYCPA